MNIFMAFSYRDDDKPLARYVERLLASQFVKPITGERLGGEQLTLEVQKRIKESDALIALLTPRDQLVDGGWTTHQWVTEELAWARANGKRAIAVVEEGVNVGGMFQPHECIPLNRDNPLEAFIRLSETINGWKQDKGRTVKVQIAPETIAKKLDNHNVICRRRFWKQGDYTDWQKVTAVPEQGGTFVYLEGVQDEHLVQLEAEEAGCTWQSLATSQWMLVQLKAKGAGV
ncbi:MAG: hypothetical protein WC208_07365 [Gallionella sp.]|jgi:hypothetical protein